MMARLSHRTYNTIGMHQGRERVLVTPEGISLPVTVASKGARLGALLLDLAFIVFLMIAMTLILLSIAGGLDSFMKSVEGEHTMNPAFGFLLIVWIIGMFLFRNAYFLFFELGPRGATPGKRMAGIRIASRDGGSLNAEMVIARNLLRDIELFLPIVMIVMGGGMSSWAWLAGVGWFAIFMCMPLFNRDGLRAGDVIAGTWVLERPRLKLQAAMSHVEASAEEETALVGQKQTYRYVFQSAELAVYGEFELQSLERILRDQRPASLNAVYETIAVKIGRDDGEGDEQRFLSEYYTQLRAYLEAQMRMGRRKRDKFADIQST